MTTTMMITHRHLCITGGMPTFALLYYLAQPASNIYETILAGWLIVSIVFAHLFWSGTQDCNRIWHNPVRGSIVHRIDGVIAKITIASFVSYTLFMKEGLSTPMRVSYIVFVSGIGFTAWYSNVESTKEWCSQRHLWIHGGMHMFCCVSAFYAFVPVNI